MSVEKPAVVIDNGSFSTKCGFSSDNHPVSMFRTVVGRPSHLQGKYGREHYEVLVGDCATQQDDYDLSLPVVGGRIVHWDNMERVWHHCFYRELKVAPEDRAVLQCCAHDAPMAEKLKCCEIFFESLNSPSLCLQPHPALAVYSAGLTSGVCVDLGYDRVSINPVYEGGVIHYAHTTTNLATAQLQNYIDDCFKERGLDLNGEIIEKIRRSRVYVTPDAAMRVCKYKIMYDLPSGDTINVCNEAFMAGEMIFSPCEVLGEKSDFTALHEAVRTSVEKCDPDLHSELLAGVVLCGGLAMLAGLGPRLQSELEALLGRPAHVHRSDEAYVAQWLGGAIFVGLPDSSKVCVTKDQYLEHGERIVRNKFTN